jgi:hypothetical protein
MNVFKSLFVYYMSDLINKSIDELIEFCKEK